MTTTGAKQITRILTDVYGVGPLWADTPSLPIFLPSGDERDPFIGLFDVGEGREGFAIVMPVWWGQCGNG